MAAEINDISWSEVEAEAHALAARQHVGGRGAPRYVFGVPNGGYPVAALVAAALGCDVLHRDPLGPGRIAASAEVLVVDDLVDSGRTLARYAAAGYRCDALFRKSHSPEELAPQAAVMDGWLVFPWETSTGPTDAVVRLLEFIGEDPSRDGLVDTPKRVVKALGELTAGYRQDPAAVLGTTFDVPYDEMVLVRGIPFASMCEHHMLPFTGRATVAYVPTDRVVGLSKLARLVEVFARRLQVQERMTSQIAQTIHDVLHPLGVAVLVEGRHSCMASRGVQKDAPMVTSALLGLFKDDPAARAEFMALATAKNL